MPITLQQFIDRLIESGIVLQNDITTILDLRDTPPEDGEQFARILINQKKLTIYQAERISQGNFQGLLLGNYLILNQIGAGGMGQVFLAEHKRMGRRVALKTLPQSLANDPTIVSRFEREVLAAAKLSHPNIVTAHDADEADGIHFFVMEYIHGVDLSKLVNQHGPLSVNLALNLVLQTSQGLRYAHERGIIHRDIKPANLLVTPEGTVKILDMGLARLESDDESHATSLTTAGSMLGTVNYMSPEQALDTHSADARSDIYSLGCVLYFLLTGDSVYEGKTAIQKILAHREEPIPSLRTRLPNLPEQLDLIFQKMLAKNPVERYQTMHQVIEELEACQPADLTETETSLFSNNQPDDDSEMYYFSDGPVQASSRTVVQPLSDQDASEAERLTASRLQDTLIGNMEIEPHTEFKQTAPPRKRPPSWLISGGLLAVVLLAGAAFLVLQNKSGMATRAEIPDAHPVENAGMVTRVENRLPEQPEKPSVPPETTEKQTADFALAFDGEDDYVELPLTTKDLDYPLTVEATVLCRQQKAIGEIPIVSLFFQNGIQQLLGYDFEDGNWLALQKTDGHMSEKKSRSRPGLLEEKIQLAAVFDKETIRLFVNGKEQKEGSSRDTIVDLEATRDNPVNLARSHLFYGEWKDCYLNGYLDEVRISNFARYTADYQPEDVLTSDVHTIALYHFNEGTGKILKDASGKGHDGIIHGATWVELPVIPNWTKENEHRFYAELAKLDTEAQIEAFRKKMIELNPGYKGVLQYHSEDGKVLYLSLLHNQLKTIWPVGAFRALRKLQIGGENEKTKIYDLEPLKGLPLTYLDLKFTSVSDLSPLAEMPLDFFECFHNNVSDLSPLAEMPLTHLNLNGSQVTDLSALQGLPLSHLDLSEQQVTDLTPLQGMPLYYLNLSGVPVSDLTPLRGMKLESIVLNRSNVTDLSALQKMPLRDLQMPDTYITDLSPLKGMPLENLQMDRTKVKDLSPLQGMPLRILQFLSTGVSDLSPLEGMQLEKLQATGTVISDLSPLRDMKQLKSLAFERTKVSDLSPLENLPIEILICRGCPLTNLDALKTLPLNQVFLPVRSFDPAEEQLLRSLPVKTINGSWPAGMPVQDFWTEFEATQQAAIQFAEETASLPAEEQTPAVLAKLKELNKTEDLQLETRLSEGFVSAAKLTLSEPNRNITPLRTFNRLKELEIVKVKDPLIFGEFNSLDLSPVRSVPLEVLICDRGLVLRNLPLLKDMPTLKTINGQPSGDYLKAVAADPWPAADKTKAGL